MKSTLVQASRPGDPESGGGDVETSGSDGAAEDGAAEDGAAEDGAAEDGAAEDGAGSALGCAEGEAVDEPVGTALGTEEASVPSSGATGPCAADRAAVVWSLCPPPRGSHAVSAITNAMGT